MDIKSFIHLCWVALFVMILGLFVMPINPAQLLGLYLTIGSLLQLRAIDSGEKRDPILIFVWPRLLFNRK